MHQCINTMRTERTPLKLWMEEGRVEAGLDEAGRGCLAGPVYAAAVIWSAPGSASGEADESLPIRQMMSLVRDSKTLSDKQRVTASAFVRSEAWAWGVGVASVEEIEQTNILKATMLAMRRALDAMIVGNGDSGGSCRGTDATDTPPIPEHILVDGERFTGYQVPVGPTDFVTHSCVVDGDKTYTSIAAASILAKTRRDNHVKNEMHPLHPEYGWDKNKGYGTKDHLTAIQAHGASREHRMKFLSGEGAAGDAMKKYSTRIGHL